MGAGQAKEEWNMYVLGKPIPPGALIAGKVKGEEIYVGRSYQQNKGLLMVGYSLKGGAYTSINGRLERIFTPFEMLSGRGHVWVSTQNFQIPKGAVAVGVNSEGHTLYVGRVRSLDPRDKTQHTSLVSVNPNLKAYGKLDSDEQLKILNNTCQILVEAPARLKFTDADLGGPKPLLAGSSLAEERTLSVSKHLANHVKSGLALIVHIAKYNNPDPEISRLNISHEDDKKCCVCLVSDKDALLMPCRHVCCCFECGQVLKKTTSFCPLCRNRISDIMKIFI